VSRKGLIEPMMMKLTLMALLFPVTGVQAQTQKLVVRDGKPPAGSIILFDGKDLSAWKHRGTGEAAKWAIVDGVAEVTPGTPDLITRQEFGDFQLHVEFNIPVLPPEVKSQERGNSGVYMHGHYEVQILDSFNNETYKNGMCGSIYEQKEPDINACKPAGEWQTYDITFRSPRFGPDGKLTERARITVWHNEILIHKDIEIQQDFTRAGMEGPPPKTGPILLQNHGSKVRYRNIWVKPLTLK
jgi:hypothetical protein